ncbi:Putative membrane protein [Klebsiella pneumoniae ISC21]|nr:Putative membrane protein [Klebsiella pneumoniae ISC21]
MFITLMLAIAVLCSWVGALCWNIASQRLPTVILGPLIVFETLAGLLYTFLLRQSFTAVTDPERDPAAGARRSLRRTRQTGKTDVATADERKKSSQTLLRGIPLS